MVAAKLSKRKKVAKFLWEFMAMCCFIQTVSSFKQKTKTIGKTIVKEYYLLSWKPCSHLEVYT